MRSMTGYGRAEQNIEGWQITIELSAVNRKQTDIMLHLPSGLTALESELKKQIAQQVLRGRVTARILVESTKGGSKQILLDQGLAKQYFDLIQSLEKQNGVSIQVNGEDLLRVPGLLTFDQQDLPLDDLKSGISLVLGEALTALLSMQQAEGHHLHQDLESRLAFIEQKITHIAAYAHAVIERYRKNLHQRLSEAGLDIDLNDDRLLREIGLFADRCDISEEITRARSHIKQFRTYMNSEDAVGRSLDFLCQEFNREINTIGSKANDAQLAQHVVEAKTELEKIREQVQNIQ
ncbi:MAG: YicC family protein [Verrucomicrobiales bacterium]|nr:YicC family protein [Verrucomicrobiales bacterium]